MAKRKKKISAKAIVMGIVLACVLCLVAVIVLTCNNGVITSDEAFEVVLEAETPVTISTVTKFEENNAIYTFSWETAFNGYININYWEKTE
jgi:hypothetical protein